MREPGGDDRFAGRHRLDEDAGGHLLSGVVGKQDDIGPLDQAAELAGLEVARVERDGIVDAEVADLGLEPTAIHVPVAFEHLGVGLAHDVVPRGRVDVPQLGHGGDAPLDALALAQQAPRQHDGGGVLVAAGRLASGSRVDGTVGDDTNLPGGDRVVPDEPVLCGQGHGHDGVRQQHQLVQDGLLAHTGRHQDGVQDDDDRPGHGSDDIEHVLAVRAAEDAVLVLDDDDVIAVEPDGGGLCPALLPAHPLVPDLGWPCHTGDVDDVDDANGVLR